MKSIIQFQNNQQRIFASVVDEIQQELLMDVWNAQNQSLEELELEEYSRSSVIELVK
jgi:hypothetical protein